MRPVVGLLVLLLQAPQPSVRPLVTAAVLPSWPACPSPQAKIGKIANIREYALPENTPPALQNLTPEQAIWVNGLCTATGWKLIPIPPDGVFDFSKLPPPPDYVLPPPD